MARLTWDQVGERTYETGVDRGVLFVTDAQGAYGDGVAWNGLTTVTESPSGAESNPQYADNIKYLDLRSAEEFGATIEAFTYPTEFAECDGTAFLAPGVAVGQQARKPFGLAYRSKVGNDTVGDDYGYKLHLVYGATAAPSEKAYGTINDSPEALTFSWELTTSPVEVPGLKPAALLVISAHELAADDLSTLEDILYGTDGVDPRLPLPAEVLSIVTGATTAVLMTGANAPTFDSGTGVITLPAVTGVTWKINGQTATSGAKPAIPAGSTRTVTAHAADGYVLSGDDDWSFTRPA